MDPYTQVYRALRNWILDDDDIIALQAKIPGGVKIANVPDLTNEAGGNKTPIKPGAQNADFVEILIWPTTTTYSLGNTNTGHMITKRFSIRIADNQQVLDDKFHPTQWALTAAFARLHRNSPTLDLAFVRKLSLIDDRSAYGDNPDATRGTPGWVSIANVDVLMAFTDGDFDIHGGR